MTKPNITIDRDRDPQTRKDEPKAPTSGLKIKTRVRAGVWPHGTFCTCDKCG